MSNKTWKEVVEAIRPMLGTATHKQRQLIEFLGLEIQKDLPLLVVAAKLRDYLGDVIGIPASTEPNEYTLAYIESLSNQNDRQIKPQTKSEAEAWVNHLHLRRRVEHLEKTKIEAGDIVEATTSNRIAEVSSIGDEGRVYFKGGHGAGAWPDILRVRARRNDNSPGAAKMRVEARNCEALNTRIGFWSESKHRELVEYAINDQVTEYDIDQLEQVISVCPGS